MTHVPSGLIAILRGVTPDEVLEVAHIVVEAGFSGVEVPLNSPDPFASIRLIADAYGDRVEVGAGTVLAPHDVAVAHEAGAHLIVSPHVNPKVISLARDLGMRPIPGAATPTEAFTALAAGACDIKVFPADAVGVHALAAWRTVIPSGTRLFPVGGISVETLPIWAAARVDGAGIGSSLYKPGRSLTQVEDEAYRLARVWADTARPSTPPSERQGSRHENHED